MSDLTRAPAGATHLLARILDEPDLAPIVRSLDGGTLVGLVRHVGLEDAGEILSLASPEQIASMFDEDLWRPGRAGADEAFDPLRFALWLEVLLEAGEEQAIAKMAEMDEDFLALAIAHHVHVLDLDELQAAAAALDRDEQTRLDQALEQHASEELEEFRVIAKDARTWEPITTLLLGLDRDHHALLRRLLERVAVATSERIDDEGGLCEVLTHDEMLANDVAAAREDRREREGFVAPSQAGAFLRLCLVTPLAELLDTTTRDPIQRAAARVATSTTRPRPPLTPRAEAFLARIGGAGSRARPRRLGAGTSERRRRATQSALHALRERDPAAFAARLEELAFLVNVVLAACGGDPALHPADATEMTLAVCDVGLDALARHLRVERDEVLERRELAPLFRVGWHLGGADPWKRATFERFLRGAPLRRREPKAATPSAARGPR